MSQFKPCVGRLACAEGITHCMSCGRPIDHVVRTRQVVNDLAELIMDADYDNVEEFLEYIVSKTKKKINHRREHASEERQQLEAY